jgi:hypothetical protein
LKAAGRAAGTARHAGDQPASSPHRNPTKPDPRIARAFWGLIGKDDASPYREDRTLASLKVKQPHYREGKRGWEPKT